MRFKRECKRCKEVYRPEGKFQTLCRKCYIKAVYRYGKNTLENLKEDKGKNLKINYIEKYKCLEEYCNFKCRLKQTLKNHTMQTHPKRKIHDLSKSRKGKTIEIAP